MISSLSSISVCPQFSFEEKIIRHRGAIEAIASCALSSIVVCWVGSGLTLSSVILLGTLSLTAIVNDCAQAIMSGKSVPSREVTKLSLMNLFNLSGPYYVIHEGGHALAAMTFFKHASPKISFYPFKHGMTEFFVSYGLTPIGKKLGRRVALLAVAAAGIVCTTLMALMEFALSHGLQAQFPNLSKCLDLHAKVQILHDLIYCFTTFVTDKNNPYHDLMALWEDGGIHPLLPIALMISLPLLEHLLLKYI